MKADIFTVSHTPSKGGVIIYKAAVEQNFEDEAEKLGLEKFTIKKGEYTGREVTNFMKNPQHIGQTFQELLTNPRIDPNGACIEVYLNENDVRCMILLTPAES